MSQSTMKMPLPIMDPTTIVVALNRPRLCTICGPGLELDWTEACGERLLPSWPLSGCCCMSVMVSQMVDSMTLEGDWNLSDTYESADLSSFGRPAQDLQPGIAPEDN